MNVVDLKNQFIQLEDKIDEYLYYRIFSIEGKYYGVKKIDIYHNEIVLRCIDNNEEMLISFENLSSYIK